MQDLPSLQYPEGSVVVGLPVNIPETPSCDIAPKIHMSELMAEFNRLYQFDEDSGALRQKGLTVEAVYDEEYVRSRYDTYITTTTISKLRADILGVFCPFSDQSVLDFGCGNGSFLHEMSNRGWDSFGMDISSYPFWDQEGACKAPNSSIPVGVVTFFDSLEHLPRPQAILKNLNCRYVVISLPWLPSESMNIEEFVESFMNWKHRRYGEHLWHFNPATLSKMMENAGFYCVHVGNFEDRIRKGDGTRPNILTAIFEKLPE